MTEYELALRDFEAAVKAPLLDIIERLETRVVEQTALKTKAEASARARENERDDLKRRLDDALARETRLKASLREARTEAYLAYEDGYEDGSAERVWWW